MYRLFRPLLFHLEAERAHRLTLAVARLVQPWGLWALTPYFNYEHPALTVQCWHLTFPNPVGLAAGLDKNARLVRFWEALGFGFVEVGSISARPCSGNPPPRLFRLPEDRALINRMGLNNDGAEQVARRLQRMRHRRPLGINLAKTHDPSILGEAAIADFCESFRRLAPLADYVTLNISCPNTAEGKTFEDPKALDALLRAIFAVRRELKLSIPVLLKLSPPPSNRTIFDSQLEEIVAVAQTHGIAGFVAINTASDRAELRTSPAILTRIGPGGLSGRPLATRARCLLFYLYRLTEGKLPLISVGGIDSVEEAYARIRAGASLVQLYTGLIYEGPGLVRRIKQGLVEKLEQDGFDSVQAAIGIDA
ncbi:quinone-dependent dihydroorotate dehydrogenase [Rhodothermus profundi]|nr:quinone-dependent dihydroorotate dehydrogenase [Rhodothermus profundi]